MDDRTQEGLPVLWWFLGPLLSYDLLWRQLSTIALFPCAGSSVITADPLSAQRLEP